MEVPYGGEHPGWGTHNAIVHFGSSYLELIAVNNLDEARARPRGARLLAALERGPGWLGYALRSADLDASVREIRDRGLPIGDPQPGRRTRPDGVLLQWRTASFDDAMWGGLLPFLIQHESPPPDPASAIAAVEIAVADLDAAIPTYRALFGQEPLRQQTAAAWQLEDGAEVTPPRGATDHDGLASDGAAHWSARTSCARLRTVRRDPRDRSTQTQAASTRVAPSRSFGRKLLSRISESSAVG